MVTVTKAPFHIILIKPSKYDDDGYIIRWAFGMITSNSLACLYGLTQDVVAKGILGADVPLVVRSLDESYQKIDVKKISRRVRDAGARRWSVLPVSRATNSLAPWTSLWHSGRKDCSA